LVEFYNFHQSYHQDFQADSITNRKNRLTHPKSSSNMIQKDSKSQKLTPYQGSKRCFGHFRCTCGRKWQSGNSWANKFQKCEGCDTQVYPFKQTPLQRSENKVDLTKEHPMHLCQKCQELGRSCVNKLYN
jgi:hypothetical protein